MQAVVELSAHQPPTLNAPLMLTGEEMKNTLDRLFWFALSSSVFAAPLIFDGSQWAESLALAYAWVFIFLGFIACLLSILMLVMAAQDSSAELKEKATDGIKKIAEISRASTVFKVVRIVSSTALIAVAGMPFTAIAWFISNAVAWFFFGLMESYVKDEK